MSTTDPTPDPLEDLPQLLRQAIDEVREHPIPEESLRRTVRRVRRLGAPLTVLRLPLWIGLATLTAVLILLAVVTWQLARLQREAEPPPPRPSQHQDYPQGERPPKDS